MAQNVKFIRGDTAKINGASVTDGQLLYNTTTGQHYIDNESTRVEVGKPVVNTVAEVNAITEPNISCGTLAVKELINSNLGGFKMHNLGQMYLSFNSGHGVIQLPFTVNMGYALLTTFGAINIALPVVLVNGNVINVYARDLNTGSPSDADCWVQGMLFYI